MESNQKDLYAILELSGSSSTAADIKAAYRRLALLHHPDKNGGTEASTEAFKLLQEAWETLGDEVKRHEYDATYVDQAQLKKRECDEEEEVSEWPDPKRQKTTDTPQSDPSQWVCVEEQLPRTQEQWQYEHAQWQYDEELRQYMQKEREYSREQWRQRHAQWQHNQAGDHRYDTHTTPGPSSAYSSSHPYGPFQVHGQSQTYGPSQPYGSSQTSGPSQTYGYSQAYVPSQSYGSFHTHSPQTYDYASHFENKVNSADWTGESAEKFFKAEEKFQSEQYEEEPDEGTAADHSATYDVGAEDCTYTLDELYGRMPQKDEEWYYEEEQELVPESDATSKITDSCTDHNAAPMSDDYIDIFWEFWQMATQGH